MTVSVAFCGSGGKGEKEPTSGIASSRAGEVFVVEAGVMPATTGVAAEAC